MSVSCVHRITARPPFATMVANGGAILVGFAATESKMPIYQYEAREGEKGCPKGRAGFEVLQSLREAPLSACPDCGSRVERVPAAAAVGFSQSNLDDRAKAAGFTKLKRLGKGEYERQY